MIPDLDKLRRFSLLAAFLLFSYSLAGVHLVQGEKISLLGIPLAISSPELLPLGLVALSVYGLARFFYYGVMLSPTPFRIRRDILKMLHAEGGRGTYAGSAFLGPTKFSTTPSVFDRVDVEVQVDQIIAAFPKLGQRIPEGKIMSNRYHDEDGNPLTSWHAELSIPITCRLAAFFQDVDYTAPIWANFIALGIFSYS